MTMTLCLTRTAEEEEARVRRLFQEMNISEVDPRRSLLAAFHLRHVCCDGLDGGEDI